MTSRLSPFLLLCICFAVVSCDSRNAHKITNGVVPQDRPSSADQAARQRPSELSHVELLTREHWVVADAKSVWITHDGGTTWKETLSPVGEEGEGKSSGGLSFINQQTGFAILRNRLFSTNDSGLKWSVVGDLDFEANSIFFADPLNGWAVGSVWPEPSRDSDVGLYVGRMWRTQDGGETWREVALPKTSMDAEHARWALNDITFSDNRTGWAVGDGVFLRSSDGGVSWKELKITGAFSSVVFENRNLGWAIHRGIGMFELTTDGGATWRHVEMPRMTNEVRVVFSTSEGFALQQPNDFVSTANGGKTWESVELPQRISTRISSASNFDGTYVGRARDGTLVIIWLLGRQVLSTVSTDDGKSWN